jgi:alkylhydroperoxidase family enzyme
VPPAPACTPYAGKAGAAYLVAVRREAKVFTEAGRSASELAEQGTRIADAAAGVTGEAKANAAKHYQDHLAALVSLIALINTCNRVNIIIRQPAREYQPRSAEMTAGLRLVG